MASADVNIERYVDSYLMPRYQKTTHNLRSNNKSEFAKRTLCNLCCDIQGGNCCSGRKERKMINQDDIDLLELMDPKVTAESYMKTIMKLYKKEDNLRPSEGKNEPMQLTLSTRQIVNSCKSMSKCRIDGNGDFEMCERGVDDENMKEVELEEKLQIQKLRDTCYIGLGRLIINREQKYSRFELSKANYHTRQYLLPQVHQTVAKFEQQNNLVGQKKYYLVANANSRGINFQVDKMPPLLSQELEWTKYRQIICTLNEIIQKNVYNHKAERFKQKKINPLFIWLFLILMVIMSLLIINSGQIGSQIIEMICLIASFCLLIFILMFSCHRYNEEIRFVSLIDHLNIKITDYLNFLNSRPATKLNWKTEKNLYWIQITLITAKQYNTT